jgi:hypothetical protein
MNINAMLAHSKEKFQKTVSHITKKRYLQTKYKVTLINMVIISSLQYRMRAFLLPFTWCEELDR